MSENTRITTSQIQKNIFLSLFVQIVSLLISVLLNLIVPKFIDELQYAYWQMFVLYIGYVGVLHFGLLDGIVLRYSQYDYEQLDKERIRSQFKILLFSTGVMSVLGIVVASLFLPVITKTVVILVSIGIVTKNFLTYNSYSFQITNRINKYAVLTITQRVTQGVIVAAALILGGGRFEWFCIAELLGDVVANALGCIFNKGMYFGKSIPFKDALKEWKINVGSGILLLLANWSAMLLVGSAKMVVQWKWDEFTFGKVAFAFSISNLFLVFINAISVVLFPSLKRMEEDKLPTLYGQIRGIISPLLFIAMLAYFPGAWLLNMFMPNYSASLVYLGTLLPIIIYSSKVSLLTNNYLKAYRKEKFMLIVNAISIAVAFVSFAVCAYVFNSLTAVLVCTVGAIMLNSVLSEIVVMKTIKANFIGDFIVEFIMTAAFIVIANTLPLWWACGAYALALLAYLVYNGKRLTPIFNRVKDILRRKTK